MTVAGAKAVVTADEIRPKATNVYQLVTGENSEGDRRHWDRMFKRQAYVFGKEPSALLRSHVEKLPLGRALDIAMGEGRNAVFLAKKGFDVEGVDLSEVALKKARRLAKENRVRITAINADLNHYAIAPDAYQVILNIDYLQRSLLPQIKRGLKRGGVVVFEVGVVLAGQTDAGSEHFHLQPGELRKAFEDFEVLHYSEGASTPGEPPKARLVGRKR